jgi:hypothetical protein
VIGAKREQRRAQDRQRLKNAAEQLLTSEGWQRWVQVRARGGLARLSLNNQLLVALACPDGTFVARFKARLKLGDCPVKGSKAIRILAPMPVRERNPQTGERTGETQVLFKAVSVFAREQVAAIDGVEQASLEPPCEPLTGDAYAHLPADRGGAGRTMHVPSARCECYGLAGCAGCAGLGG